jgi:hypothetical protein
MTTITRVQGDVNDTATITLAGVADLTTAASAEAHVKLEGVTATLTCTIPDPNGLDVDIALGAGAGWLATAAPGPWKLEVQVTFNDGRVLTWPATGTDTIQVRADLG